MHASPSDFRAVRRDGVVLHFALLDEIAYARADFPVTGSRGTFVEDACEDAHWAFVVSGDLKIELDEGRREIASGTAFHIPAGLSHRLIVPGRARLAGFARVASDAAAIDDELRSAGFEVVRSERGARSTAVSVVRPRPEMPPDPGEVVVEMRRMGDLLYARTRLGRRAGYTGERCDLAHWGLVTSGSLAIEWEDAVEVVTTGDVFYCPPGPPGHRLQAAEPAIIVDFTPIDGFGTTERIAEWRRGPANEALREAAPAARVELAALV